MALTKDQVRDAIAARLVRERRGTIVFGDIVSAFQNTSAAEKAQFAAAVNAGKRVQVGAMVLQVTNRQLLEDMKAEADTILADDQLSLAEVERIWLSG